MGKCLSCLEYTPSKRLYNLTKEGRNLYDLRDDLYSLRDDRSIVIESADRSAVLVVWDRQDYLKEAYRNLDCKEVYEQVPDYASVLANTLVKALEKIRLRGGGICRETLLFFF